MGDTGAPPPSGSRDEDALAATVVDASAERVMASPQLERGATLGRFVVLGTVAAGGMGVVLAAYDPQLDRKVAVKVLRAAPGAGTEAEARRARVLHEARAMAKLSHPNVVTVYEIDRAAPRPRAGRRRRTVGRGQVVVRARRRVPGAQAPRALGRRSLAPVATRSPRSPRP